MRYRGSKGVMSGPVLELGTAAATIIYETIRADQPGPTYGAHLRRLIPVLTAIEISTGLVSRAFLGSQLTQLVYLPESDLQRLEYIVAHIETSGVTTVYLSGGRIVTQ